jgi:hypothetical protein
MTDEFIHNSTKWVMGGFGPLYNKVTNLQVALRALLSTRTTVWRDYGDVLQSGKYLHT